MYSVASKVGFGVSCVTSVKTGAIIDGTAAYRRSLVLLTYEAQNQFARARSGKLSEPLRNSVGLLRRLSAA